MGVMMYVLGALGLAILTLAVTEIGPLFAWLAPRIVKRAARRLPEQHRIVREEEWLAQLNSMEDMRLFRLLSALGFGIAAVRLGRTPSVRLAAKQEKAAAAVSALVASQEPSREANFRVYQNVVAEEFDHVVYAEQSKHVHDPRRKVVATGSVELSGGTVAHAWVKFNGTYLDPETGTIAD